MIDKLSGLIAQPKFVFFIFIALAIIASSQSMLSDTKTYEPDGAAYQRHNNYIIFKQSYFHLKQNQDLYILYPNEHWDLYKYSPTFSALFTPLALMPDWLGLHFWNLINAILFLLAVYYLPGLNNFQKGSLLILSAFELMTSLQNSQSNGLMAGLMIGAFAFLERDRFSLAMLCIVASVYVKLFGIVAFALCIFYPQKIKLIAYAIFWSIVFFAIPFMFLDWPAYQVQLGSWLNMLSHDHSTSYGYSVMGWLYSWFSLVLNKAHVFLAGVILFLMPMIRYKQFNNLHFKLLTLASILIWVVIFNHKAESPTFIIAMSGVALWFVISKKNKLNIGLFILAFLFTSLSSTDLFPASIRESVVKPYCLKAVPCILIWIKIFWEMMTIEKDKFSLT